MRLMVPLVLVVVLAGACASSPAARRVVRVTAPAAHTANYVTTVQALERGGQEANPLWRWIEDHPTLGATTYAGLLLYLDWTYSKLEPQHPRLVFWLRLMETVASSWIAAHNHQQARE